MTPPREAAATIAINTAIDGVQKVIVALAAVGVGLQRAADALNVPDVAPPVIVPPVPPVGPKASFTVAQAANPSRQATFTSTSTGSPTLHSWSWGDSSGESHVVETAGKTWATPGTYTVRLTVYDANGATDTTTQSITVPLPRTSVPVPPIVPPVVVPPVVPPPPAGEVVAALPRISVGVQYPGITGKTWLAVTNSQLQMAFDGAQLGDVIELANVFTGNFTLPKKFGGSDWVVVRPVASVQIAAPGARMLAKNAGGLAVIQSPNNQPAIQTLPGAHHYRFVGLEIRPTVACSTLVNFGDATQKRADIPHDLILDRCYVHGLPGLAVQRGVVLNCNASAVIDSTISEIHDNNGDSQAILSYNGDGPFLIDNCYLESSGENVMFGGANPSILGLVPSDVTIRRTHFTVPLAWKGTWNCKNLLEFKSVRRALVEACVFENEFASSQVGGAINMKSASAGGDPAQGTQDVTLRRCIMRNVRSGFTIESIPEAVGIRRNIDTARITIEDFLAYDVGETKGDVGIGFFHTGNAADVLLRHVTVLAPNSAITLSGKAQRLRIRDSVFAGNPMYPVKGDAIAMGQPTLDAYAPGAYLGGNVIVLNDQSSAKNYPTGNSYPAKDSDIGFVDQAAKDFHLAPTSKYKGKGTDGRDPGADIDAILSATSGVIVP